MRNLKYFDMFGAPYTPVMQNNQKDYKTYFGAILSLLIYSVASAYFIYIVVLWQTDQIPPNISTKIQKVSSYKEIELDEQKLNLEMNEINAPRDRKLEKIFNKENNFLIVQQNQLKDYVPANEELNFLTESDQCYKRNNITDTICLTKKPKITFDPINPKNSEDTMLTTIQCNPNPMFQDFNCATEDDFTKFFNRQIFLSLTIVTQEYNIQTGTLEDIPNYYTFLVDQDQATYFDVIQFLYIKLNNQIRYQVTEVIINKGIIFPSYERVRYISNIEITSQDVTQKYMHRLSGGVYLPFFMFLKYHSFEQIKEVTYPSLGEVQNIQYYLIQYQILAQIGSIVSLLLVFKYIAIFFNQFQMEHDMIKQIIQFYFPQLINLKWKYNWKNQIFQVEDVKNKIQLNPVEFNAFYKKQSDIALSRMNPLNTIYEISRLQFIIQSFYKRKKIKKIHDIGIQLPNNLYQNEQSIKKNKITGKFMMFIVLQQVEEMINNSNSEINNKQKTMKLKELDSYILLDQGRIQQDKQVSGLEDENLEQKAQYFNENGVK